MKKIICFCLLVTACFALHGSTMNTVHFFDDRSVCKKQNWATKENQKSVQRQNQKRMKNHGRAKGWSKKPTFYGNR